MKIGIVGVGVVAPVAAEGARRVGGAAGAAAAGVAAAAVGAEAGGGPSPGAGAVAVVGAAGVGDSVGQLEVGAGWQYEKCAWAGSYLRTCPCALCARVNPV